MIPHSPALIASKLETGRLRDIRLIKSGFYFSNALEFTA
jgi:hypothetical protein